MTSRTLWLLVSLVLGLSGVMSCSPPPTPPPVPVAKPPTPPPAPPPKPPPPKGWSRAVPHSVDCIVVGERGGIWLLGHSIADEKDLSLHITRLNEHGEQLWHYESALGEERFHVEMSFSKQCGAARGGELVFAAGYTGTVRLEKNDSRRAAGYNTTERSLLVAKMSATGKPTWLQTL